MIRIDYEFLKGSEVTYKERTFEPNVDSDSATLEMQREIEQWESDGWRVVAILTERFDKQSEGLICYDTNGLDNED